MTQHAQVLNFTEALRLTESGARIIFRKTAQKAKATQVVPLKKCHDGAWRMLAEAPRFRNSGFVYTDDWSEFLSQNRKTKP